MVMGVCTGAAHEAGYAGRAVNFWSVPLVVVAHNVSLATKKRFTSVRGGATVIVDVGPQYARNASNCAVDVLYDQIAAGETLASRARLSERLPRKQSTQTRRVHTDRYLTVHYHHYQIPGLCTTGSGVTHEVFIHAITVLPRDNVVTTLRLSARRTTRLFVQKPRSPENHTRCHPDKKYFCTLSLHSMENHAWPKHFPHYQLSPPLKGLYCSSIPHRTAIGYHKR